MAFIKKNELLPQRPIIMVLYGTPGTGKTSMACTAEQICDYADERELVDELTRRGWKLAEDDE